MGVQAFVLYRMLSFQTGCNQLKAGGVYVLSHYLVSTVYNAGQAHRYKMVLAQGHIDLPLSPDWTLNGKGRPPLN